MSIESTSRLPRLLPFLALLATLYGCGGGGGGGGGGNPPPPPPPPPPPAFDAVFSDIQSNVFTPNCATAGCHQGAGAPQGLRLDEVNSFALLVDVDSMEVPAIKRVAPGEPDNSYLIQKLEGNAAVGEQMPFGGTPLPQANINIIRQWITDGALDDRNPSTAPIRLTSLSPIPGSVLTTAPTEIVAMFDRELDVSTINTMTFVLTASGGDGTFNDGNEVIIMPTSITTPTMTPMSASMNIAAAAIGDDTYRVELFGSGASVILDIDANALDGEFGGTFPSGDATEGGDFSAQFVIATATGGLTFDEIQTTVFTPNCTDFGCHSGATPQQGMNLEAGNAYANIFNVASMEVPALLRVNPGDPDNSYLIRKLEGTAAVGAQMPFGGPPLSQTTIDDIRQWITDGAIE